MNIGEVSEWVDISSSSVRKYLRYFGDIDGCFSQSALPEQGKHRLFTDKDVGVIYWISIQYRTHFLKTPDVRAALIERLKSDEPFELPPRPEEALEMIPRDQHEEVVAANQRALEIALAERDTLRDMLREVNQTHTDEIARLNRRIGRLEQLVEQLGGEPKPD